MSYTQQKKAINKIAYAFFILMSVLVPALVKGQEVLSLEDVIKLAIENNFDVNIARNNIQVAKNNNNIGLVGGGQSTGGTIAGGATGMLPQISIQAGSASNPLGVGQTISTLKYADPSLNVTGQKLTSSSYAPSLVATWYFFDGLKMFASKRKLNRFEELSNLQYRLTVENTLLSALSAYYQMISTQQFIKSLGTTLTLSDEQRKLADQKLKAGSGTGVDVLQTQIDYNNIQVQIIQQQNLLNEQRINLNLVLKRSPDIEFNVPDTIVMKTEPEYESALANTDKSNSTILINRKNVEISQLGVKEFRGNLFPRIGVTGNYTYQSTQNDIGLVRLSQNYGYNAGFIFSWTLLNNLTTRTAIKNQLVLVNSDKIRLDAATLQEKSNLYKAYLAYKNNLNIMDLEKQSVELANQNLFIASQRFRQGISNYIEYRTVEQSYETAQFRLSQAAFNTKMSELNYLKAQGLLVH